MSTSATTWLILHYTRTSTSVLCSSTRTPSPAKSAADPTKPFVPAGSPARTTEVPCGDGVATKGKSAMAQQSANPDKIPVCAKCNEDIRYLSRPSSKKTVTQ